MSNFKIINNYLFSYTGSEDIVELPDNIEGLYGDAFCKAATLKKLVLPESILYCVGDSSSIVSKTLADIVIGNANYTGSFMMDALPMLKTISIVDTNSARVDRARPLISKLASLPDSVQIYFPAINLFACDRNNFSDIKMCAHFLRSKELYTAQEQEKYLGYIRAHARRILAYLADNDEAIALRYLIPECPPESVSAVLDVIQEMEDTELTAIALDHIGKSNTVGTAFDMSFLSDLAGMGSAPSTSTVEQAIPISCTKPTTDVIDNFEVRGTEDSVIVAGAYLGDSDVVIYPAKLAGYDVEAIAAPTKQFTVSPSVIDVSCGISALLKSSMIAYVNLKMILLTQTIQYIDETAFHYGMQKDVVFYCPKNCYAESWAKQHGYAVRDVSYFQQDYANLKNST